VCAGAPVLVALLVRQELPFPCPMPRSQLRLGCRTQRCCSEPVGTRRPGRHKWYMHSVHYGRLGDRALSPVREGIPPSLVEGYKMVIGCNWGALMAFRFREDVRLVKDNQSSSVRCWCSGIPCLCVTAHGRDCWKEMQAALFRRHSVYNKEHHPQGMRQTLRGQSARAPLCLCRMPSPIGIQTCTARKDFNGPNPTPSCTHHPTHPLPLPVNFQLPYRRPSLVTPFTPP